MEILRLQAGGHRIDLDVLGDGRAVAWSVDGIELLGAKSGHRVEYGMYAMAPWAGRLRANSVVVGDAVCTMPVTYPPWALHGTTWDAQTSVVEQRSSEAMAIAVTEIDLGPAWPWPGLLRTTWELTADRLRTTLELQALGEPFAGVVGWHPWFRTDIAGHRAHWVIDDGALAERDADYRLTGRFSELSAHRGALDDAIRVPSGRSAVEWPGLLRIDIVNSRPWFVVYDGAPGLVCIEPQSGPPNGVNDGLGDPIDMAAPGAPLVLTTEWRMTRGPRPPAG